MRISTLSSLAPGEVEVGVVYASIEGVEEESYEKCVHELKENAKALGATAVIDLKLVQSQFQWNQRTSLIAMAIKSGG